MVGCLDLQNGTVILIFVAKCFRKTVKKCAKWGMKCRKVQSVLVDLLKHVGICHLCQCNFLKTAYADLAEYLLRILP